MSILNKNLNKFTVAFLIVCLTNLCILASTTVATIPDVPQTNTGTLQTSGGEPVTVNGNKVGDGTTILTNSEILTPVSTNAGIDLKRFGRIDVSCGSAVKVVFQNNQVILTIIKGFAKLTTNQGIAGTVVQTDGKTQTSNPALAVSVLEVGTQIPCTAPIVVPPGAGLSKAALYWLIAGIAAGGVITTVVIVKNISN